METCECKGGVATSSRSRAIALTLHVSLVVSSCTRNLLDATCTLGLWGTTACMRATQSCVCVNGRFEIQFEMSRDGQGDAS
jgi:hypothetical protein